MSEMIPAGRMQLEEQAARQFAAMYRFEASSVIVFGPDGPASDALTIDVSAGVIDTVRIVRNPGKLRISRLLPTRLSSTGP